MRKFPYLLVLLVTLFVACENESIDGAIYDQNTTEETTDESEDDVEIIVTENI